jgi:hypothetical protein
MAITREMVLKAAAIGADGPADPAMCVVVGAWRDELDRQFWVRL